MILGNSVGTGICAKIGSSSLFVRQHSGVSGFRDAVPFQPPTRRRGVSDRWWSGRGSWLQREVRKALRDFGLQQAAVTAQDLLLVRFEFGLDAVVER